jgi:hypothetical protein
MPDRQLMTVALDPVDVACRMLLRRPAGAVTMKGDLDMASGSRPRR